MVKTRSLYPTCEAEFLSIKAMVSSLPKPAEPKK